MGLLDLDKSALRLRCRRGNWRCPSVWCSGLNASAFLTARSHSARRLRPSANALPSRRKQPHVSGPWVLNGPCFTPAGMRFRRSRDPERARASRHTELPTARDRARCAPRHRQCARPAAGDRHDLQRAWRGRNLSIASMSTAITPCIRYRHCGSRIERAEALFVL